MPVTLIHFDTPDIADGPVASVTRDGVTVSFSPPAWLIPLTADDRPGRGLVNGGQDRADETGHQKPMWLAFDRLQTRVRMQVGLEELDPSVTEVVATLHALDSDGAEVAQASRSLGRGPVAGQSLEATAQGDVIQRVRLEYSGLLRELVEELELESADTVAPAADTTAPVIRIARPRPAQQFTTASVQVQGAIEEAGDVTLTLNGVPTAVRRGADSGWEFNADVELPDERPVIDARAVDASGNVGTAQVRVDLRVAAAASVTAVRFTQSGVLDDAPIPSRRVAGKSALVMVTPSLRTAGGRPAVVESATLRLEGLASPVTFAGHRRPSDNRFSAPSGPYRDGEPIYFFIDGRHLRSGVRHRLVLRLGDRGRVVLDQPLASDLTFTHVRGLTMLLVPQHRPLSPALLTALIQTLAETARMYPVPDGVTDLDGDAPGGIRFRVLPPTSYAGHTDPADAGWTRFGEIAYDQGFVLVDHAVASGMGPDQQWGTADDPATFWAGEVLPVNFVGGEDANRDGVLSDEERARTIGGGSAQSVRRYDNWGAFVRDQAESARRRWNEARAGAPARQARRAIALVTRDGDLGQNRTGLAGNAGRGETSFWADVDMGLGCFIPHELGHTFGFVHADDGRGSCAMAGEAVNLLSRTIVPAPTRVMCSGVGECATHFFSNTEYGRVFDSMLARREN